MFRLFHEDVWGIIGINKGLIWKLAVSDIVVHSTILSKHLHVIIVFTDLFNALIQQFDKHIATPIHEPKFEMTVARKESLVRTCTSLQISVSKKWKLYWFLIKSSDGYIKRRKVLCEFLTHEDDAVSCEKNLNSIYDTVPLSYFLPRLSILTSNYMFWR